MSGGAFTQIDLSNLPTPDVVEELSFETILTAMRDDLVARFPAIEGVIDLESEPARKLLEVAAFRETLIRQRVNDAARAVMLAFASGSDLDQIGANYNVARLIVDPGDPLAVPPIPETPESDTDFRKRIQLALEGITTAGSEGSYVFYGLSADGDVKDIQAVSNDPGVVLIYVLSRTDDGTASPALIGKVNAALNAENIRPLTDLVTVQSASIVTYEIEADLTFYPGPDSEVIRARAEEAVRAYATGVQRIGFDVTLSGLFAALHQPGVQRVNLISPVADLVLGEGEASFATSVIVRDTGVPDV